MMNDSQNIAFAPSLRPTHEHMYTLPSMRLAHMSVLPSLRLTHMNT